MTSIRTRLLLALGLGFTGLIAVAGVWGYALLEERVTEQFDAALLAKARALVSLTEQEGGRVELDYDAAHMPEYERADAPDYFQFWLAGGPVLLRSRRLDQDLSRADSVPTAGRITNVTLPDGRAGRQVQIDWTPRGPEEDGDDEDAAEARDATGVHAAIPIVLVVARGREDLDAFLTGVFWVVLLGGLGVSVLAVLLIWRALSLGLRPLDEVASQVQALDADSLTSRVEIAGPPPELEPIVGQLNGLLTRLESSFEREKRFTGNVAHELRTPIAELRSLAEVGAAWPEDPESTRAFFQDVGSIAGRMEAVIDDLLLLARCHAGTEGLEREPTDLRELLVERWAGLRERATARGCTLRLEMPRELTIRTDAGKLGMVLANLLGNAVSHGRPGAVIRCRVEATGRRWRLVLSNPAERMTPAELERLAEPFWRKDASRSSAEHAGLGLSMVTALGDLLGLQIQFTQDEDGLFQATLSGDGVMLGRSAAPVGAVS